MDDLNGSEGVTLAELGWILGLVGVMFGITGNLRSCRKDNDAAARETATIVTSLEYLKKSVDALSGQMSANQASMVEVIARIGGVEKSVARAHTRIDRMCDGMTDGEAEGREGA